MPFDSTPTQSPAIPACVVEELRLLRQRVEEHWIAGVMDDYRGNRCLIGWILKAAKAYTQYDLVNLLSSQLPPPTIAELNMNNVERLMGFNDSRDTNEHVLELIDRVIALGKTS